jgi:hypothetical protein
MRAVVRQDASQLACQDECAQQAYRSPVKDTKFTKNQNTTISYAFVP